MKTSCDASRTAKWLGIYCRSEIYKEIDSLSYLPKNMSLKVLLGASTSNCLVLYPASDNLPPQATGVQPETDLYGNLSLARRYQFQGMYSGLSDNRAGWKIGQNLRVLNI